MTTLTYLPEVFAAPDEEAARNIILTPQAGQSPDERWARETPYLVELIAAMTPIAPGELVVDYGTGIGRLAKALIERFGCRVLGVDISPQMRGLGPGYVQSERFAAVSPEMLAAMIQAGLRVDAAISVWVLQHCLKPAIDIDLIQHALKPGGSLLVVNTNHRAVPTLREEDQSLIWTGDGQDVRALLAERLEPVSDGLLDPAVVGQAATDATFWAAFRKA